MEYIVTSPDGRKFRVNAPEGATREQALAYAKSQFAKSGPRVTQEQIAARRAQNPAEYDPNSPEYRAKYGKPRINVSAPGAPGLALDLGFNMARNSLASVGGGLAGLGSGLVNLGQNNYNATEAVEAVSGLAGEPLSAPGRALASVQAYPFEKLGQFANWVGGETAEATGSPAAGAGLNVGIQALPAVLLRGRGTSPAGRGAAGNAGAKAPKVPNAGRASRLEGVPPTIEELGAQAKAAYQRASDAGVRIAPGSFQNLKNKIGVTLKKEGIDPTLHPQTSAAFKRIRETKGELSLDGLETLRKISNDARGAGKADGRLAGKIVDELDDYMNNIGRKDIVAGDASGFAALSEARNLYSRKAKAEEIARLVKRAEISAPNFSASGFENALRTEFRNLAKNDKKMRRFNAAEQAAIKKVAQGGKAENALRMIGKMAPTGPVSGLFGIAVSAGIPGGVALPAAGLAGRYAATRMTRANALRAEELMRRGPERPRNALLNPLLRETVE